MNKKIKFISRMLTIIFTFQIILISTPVSASEQNYIMEISIPQLFSDDLLTNKSESVTGAAIGADSIAVTENTEYETDRFIVKYKNNKFDVMIFESKKKLKEISDIIKDNDISDSIEYIQPDYTLELFSNDTLFKNQWGLENNQNKKEDTNIYSIEILHTLPPDLKEYIEGNPEFKKFFINTSIEELGEKIMAGDVPGNVDPAILTKLSSEPGIVNIKNMSIEQPDYLCDIKTVEAWNLSNGNGSVVAIIDTGIDITHEDLAENIWVNTAEIPDNGIDDDGNGKIDDINGWNFTDDTNLVYDIFSAQNEIHGTHIAELISAVKDNQKGIAGAAPVSKIMPLKVFREKEAHTSDIIKAIEYAEKMGAQIVNCSWGSTYNNMALKETIQNSDMFFVCAVGNDEINSDTSPVYPAAFDCNNIIKMAPVDSDGKVVNVSGDIATNDTSAKNSDVFQPFSVPVVEGSFINISAGYYHSLALKDDNTVWAYGYNYYGQLGDGTAADKASPVQISGLTEVRDVSAKSYYSMALKNDGTVWTWGYNYYGQLGDGSTINRSTPVKIIGLEGITAIAAGGSHSLALKNDGTVWAWGLNSSGQLGDNSQINKLTPVQVSGLTGITAIAAGESHSLALKNDGTVWAWGYNYYGQLGDGTGMNKTIPVQISSLSEIATISAGEFHSLALKNDGTVWAWGYNSYGQLGDGTGINKTAPVRVNNLNEIISIAGGYLHNLAVKNDGTVWAWGDNYYGQLGDSTTIRRGIAVQVVNLNESNKIACGRSHSIALTRGAVHAWGYNNYGQLGNGKTDKSVIASQVMGLNEVKAIAAGNSHSLALKNDGTVWAWGDNNYGQLGDGTTLTKVTPVQVKNLTGIIAIAAGGYHNLALKSDGTVWAWGSNSWGQLGDEIIGVKTTAVQVSRLKEVHSIAAGMSHNLISMGDGRVWQWGYISYEIQNEDECAIIKQVLGVYGISKVEAGVSHCLVWKSDGTAWAWGHNYVGKLGTGSNIPTMTPGQVVGVDPIISIKGGDSHSLALKDDGTVWTCGNNNYGQLGDGRRGNGRLIFDQVNQLMGITAIAGGSDHNLALKHDGTVWTWGSNSNGQLGDETLVTRLEAIQVKHLSETNTIAAGYNHSLAIKNDGTVWAWGNNYCGQLGNGFKGYYEVPKYSFGTEILGVNIL